MLTLDLAILTLEISFRMQTTSIIGTIGLITSNVLAVTNPTLSSAILVYSLLIFSAATWALLFIPKLYIALLKPDRNNIDLMKRVGGGDYDEYEEMDDGSSYLSMRDGQPSIMERLVPTEQSIREH